MAWVALNCPQCSAPLPRVALWRSVKCAACGAVVMRDEQLVRRDTFRQALRRAREESAAGAGSEIVCGSGSYTLLQKLGTGADSDVYLARRLGALPLLVTLKLSSSAAAAAHQAREAENLAALHAVDGGAALYAALRLPEVLGIGLLTDGSGRHALVLRHPIGFWGDLAALNHRFPNGIDPRHSVWIWRRILDVLHFVHSLGWVHGSVSPGHALVHPKDHGVRLIGWSEARKDDSPNARASDLMRSARIVQVLLCGANAAGTVPATVPDVLASLVTRAAQDASFCLSQGARGLDALLLDAARQAFGPPTFVPLVL